MSFVHNDGSDTLLNAPKGDVRERLKLEGGIAFELKSEFR